MLKGFLILAVSGENSFTRSLVFVRDKSLTQGACSKPRLVHPSLSEIDVELHLAVSRFPKLTKLSRGGSPNVLSQDVLVHSRDITQQ